MAREIDNHKKADLGKVVCDNMTCSARGDIDRCYLDIYRNCTRYKVLKLLEEDKNERR